MKDWHEDRHKDQHEDRREDRREVGWWLCAVCGVPVAVVWTTHLLRDSRWPASVRRRVLDDALDDALAVEFLETYGGPSTVAADGIYPIPIDGGDLRCRDHRFTAPPRPTRARTPRKRTPSP